MVNREYTAEILKKYESGGILDESDEYFVRRLSSMGLLRKGTTEIIEESGHIRLCKTAKTTEVGIGVRRICEPSVFEKIKKYIGF